MTKKIMKTRNGAKEKIKVFFSFSKKAFITAILLASHVGVGYFAYDEGHKRGNQDSYNENMQYAAVQADARWASEKEDLEKEIKILTMEIDQTNAIKLRYDLRSCRQELKTASMFQRAFEDVVSTHNAKVRKNRRQ